MLVVPQQAVAKDLRVRLVKWSQYNKAIHYFMKAVLEGEMPFKYTDLFFAFLLCTAFLLF